MRIHYNIHAVVTAFGSITSRLAFLEKRKENRKKNLFSLCSKFKYILAG